MEKKPKILIVDDSELMRMKLYHMLANNYNEESLIFSDTIEGAWGKLIKFDIDIIVLDIYLPGENGTDLISDILKNKRLKDIPIIVITGTKEGSFVKMSFEKHVFAYLHKPINKEELIKNIEAALNGLKT